MAHNTHIGSAAAESYAHALLDLANADSKAQEVGQDLEQIVQAFDAEPVIGEMLANPSISSESRGAALKKAFEGRVSPLVWNFIRLLNAKNRLAAIRKIQEAYDDLLDEQFGKVEVDVTVAQKLDDETLEAVRQAVSEALKREAVIHQYVDESIIGGLMLRVQDKMIDTSVRAQLAAIKQKMLAARPRPAAV